MKRSDLIIAVNRVYDDPNIPEDAKALIRSMHWKIERVYEGVFVLEGRDGEDAFERGMRDLGAIFRQALES